MQITTIGLDIAKNVFQVHGIDATEKVIVRKQLRRGQLIKFFEALAPCEAEKQREAEARRREAERQREAEAREKMAGKPRQWWEVLGVSSQAPLEEIMRRYRQEIQLYHPDRVVGLAPEIVSVAERRTKEINAAYAEAKRLRR